jgi:LmbE family N-acetylglucosaminyl deacetylase
MRLHDGAAVIFVPDGSPPEDALARTTHMAIGAHQDDLEIMAIDGILHCFQREDRRFTGVVVTDGGGSPRAGLYRDYSDAQMRAVRDQEQKKAALVGDYSAQVLLAYSSAEVKDGTENRPTEDIRRLVEAAAPEVVYTHNLADKHPTHVAVAMRTIEALRALPGSRRPRHVYGCEVWRSLDWLLDEDRMAFDCSAHDNLQTALLGAFDSQIAGGKRYDLATLGRRRANATYAESHAIDQATGMAFAMDLTPLIQDPRADVSAYVQSFIDRFAGDVQAAIARMHNARR